MVVVATCVLDLRLKVHVASASISSVATFPAHPVVPPSTEMDSACMEYVWFRLFGFLIRFNSGILHRAKLCRGWGNDPREHSLGSASQPAISNSSYIATRLYGQPCNYEGDAQRS